MRHRRLLRAVPAVVAAAALCSTASPAHAAVTACQSSAATPTATNVAQVESTVLCLVNRERTKRGLGRLRASDRLSDAATAHSRDMVRRSYFDHRSPGGGTMMDRVRQAGWFAGARAYTVGENLAWGTGRLASPQEIVEGWMNSAGHRANILNRAFDELGVGVALGTPRAADGATYTTNFGAKR